MLLVTREDCNNYWEMDFYVFYYLFMLSEKTNVVELYMYCMCTVVFIYNYFIDQNVLY